MHVRVTVIWGAVAIIWGAVAIIWGAVTIIWGAVTNGLHIASSSHNFLKESIETFTNCTAAVRVRVSVAMSCFMLSIVRTASCRAGAQGRCHL